jgi:lytic murein transglycosylase
MTAAILTFTLALLPAGSTGPVAEGPIDRCREEIRRQAVKAGITRATFDAEMAGLVPDTTVLIASKRQPEFVTPIWDYLAVLVDSERVADGKAQLARWDSVLGTVERRFKVDRHVVVAVWGVESDYGRVMGERPLVRSLITGACLGGRQAFFRAQLIAALRIVQSGEMGGGRLVGSWAGAFGQTQFMPTTYLTRAVDQDGDNRRDIVNSTPDALGSTANYLARAGWKDGAPWAVEVRVPASYRGKAGRAAQRTLTRWARLGLARLDGERLAGDDSAGLLLPAGRKGPAFLVFKNFSAIYSYNAAEAYALAIGHLADRLRGGKGFKTPWPTDDRGLSRAERRELQERLASSGFEVGAADGMLGAKTRTAIRAFQKQTGMVVDGRAGGKVLDALRAAGRREPNSGRV